MTNVRLIFLSVVTFAGVLVVMTGVRALNVGIDTIETRNNRVNAQLCQLDSSYCNND